KKIDNLIVKRVFSFVQYDFSKYIRVRIFNSRLINKIKSKIIDIFYEKSRLVIQKYNDERKKMIFIQFLII
ncbi:hypothetical protein BDZ45DRAFT_609003, partial [Acephala macrosclerotiorum]